VEKRDHFLQIDIGLERGREKMLLSRSWKEEWYTEIANSLFFDIGRRQIYSHMGALHALLGIPAGLRLWNSVNRLKVP
jgi:hypothetical protein